jgi:hypothetical protein
VVARREEREEGGDAEGGGGETDPLAEEEAVEFVLQSRVGDHRAPVSQEVSDPKEICERERCGVSRGSLVTEEGCRGEVEGLGQGLGARDGEGKGEVGVGTMLTRTEFGLAQEVRRCSRGVKLTKELTEVRITLPEQIEIALTCATF